MDVTQMTAIGIVVIIIVIVMAWTGLIWFGWMSAGGTKKSGEIKGDLLSKEIISEKKEQMAEKPEPSKPAFKTADYDLPGAWVIFSYKETSKKWSCKECGTENILEDTRCIVCSMERR